jgi:hypothetical protein
MNVVVVGVVGIVGIVSYFNLRKKLKSPLSSIIQK